MRTSARRFDGQRASDASKRALRTRYRIRCVQVRRDDGSLVDRSVSQLSGGEWRRLGLSLSLAFVELCKQRLGLRSNLLVMDESMQHMDAEGQGAMVGVLRQLCAQGDTLIVIAHGLSTIRHP